MRNLPFRTIATIITVATIGCIALSAAGQSCGLCHPDLNAKWVHSVHANTQLDVAGELSQSHPGEAPADVIQGENCIACHSPMAVLVNGGMSEAQALAYFFTTSNGLFTANTIATNTADWPHVDCTACHNPHEPTKPAYFNSTTGQYEPMANAAQLCGQCHGNLRFGDTDHQVYNGWLSCKHANTQLPVAGELSQSHPGESPSDVIAGEDCIACHAPTAVLANGGMTEAQALGYFFTTNNGLFTGATAATNTADWPHVECVACHDPHDAGKFSYFNSTTLQYQVMTNADQLCGQCHGNLHFPDTDHLSYNINAGTGGIGVPDQQTMPGAGCTDCHMYASDVDGSNSKMFRGHTWAISVPEADGTSTTSCSVCHPGADPSAAATAVTLFQQQFQAFDATAGASVARATAAMQTAQNTNATLLAMLAEAQHNLTYAESDESGGFHNFAYLMDLLNDANAKALSFPIVDAVAKGQMVTISWTGPGTLQVADAVSGPWHDVSAATNPMTVTQTPQRPQQFYRLRP